MPIAATHVLSAVTHLLIAVTHSASALQEPQNIDKEFLRLWFRENCDPYADEVLPKAPRDLVAELSKRYIYLYERITGEQFQIPDLTEAVNDRINRNMSKV